MSTAREPQGGAKLLIDLGKSVLAGGGIKHQQNVVGRFGVEAAEDAADLGQFLH